MSIIAIKYTSFRGESVKGGETRLWDRWWQHLGQCELLREEGLRESGSENKGSGGC